MRQFVAENRNRRGDTAAHTAGRKRNADREAVEEVVQTVAGDDHHDHRLGGALRIVVLVVMVVFGELNDEALVRVRMRVEDGLLVALFGGQLNVRIRRQIQIGDRLVVVQRDLAQIALLVVGQMVVKVTLVIVIVDLAVAVLFRRYDRRRFLVVQLNCVNSELICFQSVFLEIWLGYFIRWRVDIRDLAMVREGISKSLRIFERLYLRSS